MLTFFFFFFYDMIKKKRKNGGFLSFLHRFDVWKKARDDRGKKWRDFYSCPVREERFDLSGAHRDFYSGKKPLQQIRCRERSPTVR